MKIGCHNIIVEEVPKAALDDDCVAVFNRTNNTISILDELAPTQKLVALLHEMFHCINNELEEETIEGLAQGVAQVVVDNPDFLAEYLRNLKG
jgi:hypothetical protein